MLEFDDDDSDAELLAFEEVTGEHAFTEDLRAAIVWATARRFLSATELSTFFEENDFTEKVKALSKSVVFHGPYNDKTTAKAEAVKRRGVLVAHLAAWNTEQQPIWLACIYN